MSIDSFAKRLKKHRLKKGLSQQDVANALNVSSSTYRDWEYGRKIRGENAYIQLSKVFDISITELITGKTSTHSPKIRKIEELLSELKREL